MKLDAKTIMSLARGTEYTEETDDGILFSRFTKAERKVFECDEYKGVIPKSYATAGVRLELETDSSFLRLAVSSQDANPRRKFYSFDIYCDGKHIGFIRNFTEDPVYPYKDYAFGDRRETFSLPKGNKRITVYFPWNTYSTLSELEIDDGAYIRAVPSQKNRFLLYGDSITQGYDAFDSSLSYASRLTDIFCADSVNKAIGGAIFMPELAMEKSRLNPNLITVAYGTNDWNICDIETFRERSFRFFRYLSETYPDTPIAAIAPIWRADMHESRLFGDFSQVARTLQEITGRIPNAVLIDAFGFVPQDTAYYADSYLHPNQNGFAHYADALAAALKEKFPHIAENADR